ncbi:cyclophilin-like fold protein [Terrimonas alba]|uniref:cyclophilin-like fold protein n=1 Tax=Terrimonas alba TaxID=3349636 RepID=UPI0035F3B32E
MKQLLWLVFCAFSLFTICASCDKDSTVPGVENNSSNNSNPTGSKMKIKIGNKTFTATLYDNATTNVFKSMLPMTVNMVELNGNEKYVDLSRDIPTNASNPGTIQAGDLMLYGSNTLVLFYKAFSTSYSYTRLGRIADVTGLADAVGSGNVTVTFVLENK